jgi:5'-methylthioadenosine phosphorylase
MKIGIIGGSGIYDAFECVQSPQEQTMETPYGLVTFIEGMLEDIEIIFMPRHGKHHHVPPHKINHKGNLWTMKKCGVARIISTSAVGSLNPKYSPGSIVIPDQFLDFTKEVYTFAGDAENKLIHVDLSTPFCLELAQILYKKGNEPATIGVDVYLGGTYACMAGPAFETKAEINMLRIMGADIVGMTAVPECKLAAELHICYATLALVVNWAAGIYGQGGREKRITHADTVMQVKNMEPAVIDLICSAVRTIIDLPPCSHHHRDHSQS